MTQKEVDDFLKSFAGNKDQGFDYKEVMRMIVFVGLHFPFSFSFSMSMNAVMVILTVL